MMCNYVNEHCTCTYVTAVGRQSEREKDRERKRESPCFPRILPSLPFPVTLPSHPLPSVPLPYPPLPEETKRESPCSPLFFPSLTFIVLYSAPLPSPPVT